MSLLFIINKHERDLVIIRCRKINCGLVMMPDPLNHVAYYTNYLIKGQQAKPFNSLFLLPTPQLIFFSNDV